jgi:membrane-associated phospholipid phosphatase
MKKLILLSLVMISCITLNAQNLDINVLKRINTPHTLLMDGAMRGVSNSVFMISIGAPVAMTAMALVDKDHKMMINTLLLIGATTVTLGATDIIKWKVNRTRPFDKYPSIIDKSKWNSTFIQDPSFPSGHTSSAFNLATYLSLAYPKWYVIAPAYAWAGTVAYSRMYLGQHYPSDVIGGAVLGAGTAWLTYYLNKRYVHSRKFSTWSIENRCYNR